VFVPQLPCRSPPPACNMLDGLRGSFQINPRRRALQSVIQHEAQSKVEEQTSPTMVCCCFALADRLMC